MNQENKFGEYWKKLVQYWAVFTAACGKLLEHIKVNGRAVLQKLAAWLLNARDWTLKATASVRAKGGELLQNLAARSLGIWEQLRHVYQQAKEWCKTTMKRLTPEKDAVAELPDGEERKALPEAEESKTAPAVEQIPAEEPVDVAPQAEEEPPVQKPEEPAVRTDNPYLQKVLIVFGAIGKGVRFVFRWIWRLRTLFMAIPVIWAAVKLAVLNLERLPESVGLDIQSTGEFARMITREEAVFWPLGITGFCLLLMFCSKKPILPWVISIFTLVLPWLIWILNYYA